PFLPQSAVSFSLNKLDCLLLLLGPFFPSSSPIPSTTRRRLKSQKESNLLRPGRKEKKKHSGKPTVRPFFLLIILSFLLPLPHTVRRGSREKKGKEEKETTR
ncbi:hypothetical protein H107_07689, partial [Trichophyton rubrum CBS 202.88]